ncbi:hypothetical protein M0Q97_12895 [Candidatus Dojkabacteria bacterium]|jgi:hypothetical protein|nr:hypothetical protein [Candidatus Dojkabacteria bacterium]
MNKKFSIVSVLEESEIEEMDELFEDEDEMDKLFEDEDEDEILKDFDKILEEI